MSKILCFLPYLVPQFFSLINIHILKAFWFLKDIPQDAFEIKLLNITFAYYQQVNFKNAGDIKQYFLLFWGHHAVFHNKTLHCTKNTPTPASPQTYLLRRYHVDKEKGQIRWCAREVATVYALQLECMHRETLKDPKTHTFLPLGGNGSVCQAWAVDWAPYGLHNGPANGGQHTSADDQTARLT